MPSAVSKTRSKTHSKENRRCEWELLLLTSFVIPSTAETGRVIHPRVTVAVFETVEISTPVEERPEESPLVSWAAIGAGAIAAAALTLVLLAFGAGMGFSAVSPWGNSGVAASTFQIGTGIYLIVVAMLAFTIGGFIAGRLRTKWIGVHTHEVFFRDTVEPWKFVRLLCKFAARERPGRVQIKWTNFPRLQLGQFAGVFACA